MRSSRHLEKGSTHKIQYEKDENGCRRIVFNFVVYVIERMVPARQFFISLFLFFLFRCVKRYRAIVVTVLDVMM